MWQRNMRRNTKLSNHIAEINTMLNLPSAHSLWCTGIFVHGLYLIVLLKLRHCFNWIRELLPAQFIPHIVFRSLGTWSPESISFIFDKWNLEYLRTAYIRSRCLRKKGKSFHCKKAKYLRSWRANTFCNLRLSWIIAQYDEQVFENVRVLNLFQTTDYEYLYPKSILFADTQSQPADVSKNWVQYCVTNKLSQ